MSEQRTRMKIAIDGKVYLLDTGVRKSLTQIPWESRKKVIAVLEAMKQAEHVEKTKSEETVKQPSKQASSLNQSAPNLSPTTQSSTDHAEQSNNNLADADPKDPDAIMQQLLMQQPKVQGVPDRLTAIKWMAVFFAVVITLVLLLG